MLSLVILLLLAIGGFVVVQSFTLYLDRNYLPGLAWLLVITVLGILLGGGSLMEVSSLLDFALIFWGLGTAAFFGTLFVVKLKVRDNWQRASNRLLRTLTDLDIPHNAFTVQTSDGVDIKGYHIHLESENKLRKAVVILAHGGFRSKNIMVKALMAAWLSYKYDVIGFDFRGHGESGGEWTGDGKTVADLKAVVDFARRKGYQKVGVYGRSMGGWTAVLEAVDYHDVDAIVIAGMPPGYFSEIPEFQERTFALQIPGAAFVIHTLLGVRFKHFTNDRSPIKEIAKVSPIPILILYNESDPGAGVAGIIGHWATVPENQRESTYKHTDKLPYSMDDVFNAASEPKGRGLLPGAVHVYSLMALRELLTQTETWFSKYLE